MKLLDVIKKHNNVESSHAPVAIVAVVLVGVVLAGAGLSSGYSSQNGNQNTPKPAQTLGVHVFGQNPKTTTDVNGSGDVSDQNSPSNPPPTPVSPPAVLGDTTPPAPTPSPTPEPPAPIDPPDCSKKGKPYKCYPVPCNPCLDRSIACPLNHTDQVKYACYPCGVNYPQSMICRAPVENQ